MSLDSRHPLYTFFSPDWQTMRDSYGGERAVKLQGETYLPATAGMHLDGMSKDNKGWKNYQAYKQRAVFPEYVSEAVKDLVGAMHNKPPVIDLPKVLEPLRERATLNGESLNLLLRRINEAQLIVGRFGLLLDLPSTPTLDSIPYIATYDAERIINWDNGKREDPTLQTLNFVDLDESEYERIENFEWELVNKFRVLILGGVAENETAGAYRQGLFRDANTTFSESALIEPSVRGKALDQIPFVFINATDLLPEPMMPPLLNLANISMAIYRGEADYRQSLFMQGQDTLVLSGGDSDVTYRTGVGATICLPLDGSAAYVGVNSEGLPEQRQALENDHRRASGKAGQLIDTTSRQKESGEALKVRVAAQTVTLNQIVLTGAEGLQSILRIAAMWVGADPEQVIVTPNMDFAEKGLSTAEFLQLSQAKSLGLPVSDESLHALAMRQGLTEKDFADEQLLINQERQTLLANV
jgi:hypothetical protein